MAVKRVKLTADELYRTAHACIWRDCKASYHGDMPKGWTFQINYYDRQPSIMRWTPKQWVTRGYQDVCLCPEHTELLNTFFKCNGGVRSNVIEVQQLPVVKDDALENV